MYIPAPEAVMAFCVYPISQDAHLQQDDIYNCELPPTVVDTSDSFVSIAKPMPRFIAQRFDICGFAGHV